MIVLGKARRLADMLIKTPVSWATEAITEIVLNIMAVKVSMKYIMKEILKFSMYSGSLMHNR